MKSKPYALEEKALYNVVTVYRERGWVEAPKRIIIAVTKQWGRIGGYYEVCIENFISEACYKDILKLNYKF